MSLPLTIAQTKTALAPNLTASFQADGGNGPFMYSVAPNGAGGSVDQLSGIYTAPASSSDNPSKIYDTIIATDQLGAKISSRILVGTPILLMCQVIQQELNLPDGRVYLWDQKIFQPSDNGLYVILAVTSCKPFSNNIHYVDGVEVQETNFMAMVDINILSRDISAFNRKEEVLMALNSTYAEQQQEGNSFFIGKLPPGARFTNLSHVDGAAIPYRYQISINMQYAVTKSKAIPYFDTFQTEQVTINS